MEITKSGSQPSAKGPADFHRIRAIDSPFQRHAPARIGGATVTFEPGPAPPGTRTRSGRR